MGCNTFALSAYIAFCRVATLLWHTLISVVSVPILRRFPLEENTQENNSQWAGNVRSTGVQNQVQHGILALMQNCIWHVLDQCVWVTACSQQKTIAIFFDVRALPDNFCMQKPVDTIHHFSKHNGGIIGKPNLATRIDVFSFIKFCPSCNKNTNRHESNLCKKNNQDATSFFDTRLILSRNCACYPGDLS